MTEAQTLEDIAHLDFPLLCTCWVIRKEACGREAVAAVTCSKCDIEGYICKAHLEQLKASEGTIHVGCGTRGPVAAVLDIRPLT